MRITCPHCDERAITRTSKRPSPVFYEVYAQCVNPECGWGGKLLIEFATTTNASRCPRRELRIPLDPGARSSWLEEINNH
ncbi:ogr/Delta-like zinc finger family protein [Halomonas sp. PBN3]|uniref:ogr/Delta-like zinc finger family protein n=1 Tax=Halomonas sp. PBN3 TaxID=1397528 RepID=UPI0003B90C94|nr:ogr/Delta-like zinc finger family protein [Halomonas sp. PBN3]ERS88835.1 hypothetical protein Q671_07940 [Halomonas sp. PBN3]